MRRALIRTLIAVSLFLAAAAIGYFLSSRLGQEVVRSEVEAQLSRLMDGPVTVERARVVIHLGLRLEGEDVEVYPGPGGPGLAARRVEAEIDVLSLFLGRFQLRNLVVDDLLMRIERGPDGRWSPHPLAVLQDRRVPRDDPERHLAPLRAFEAVARALLQKPLVANLVVLRNGRVEFVDRLPGGSSEPPVRLVLESVRGSWDHRWFSTASELAVDGTLVDEQDHRTRFEASGRRLAAGRLHWTVAVTALPLRCLRAYAELVDANDLQGELSGVLAFETTGEESDSAEIDWVLTNLHTDVPWGDARAQLDGQRLALQARLELRPSRLRLAEATLSSGGDSLEVRGFIERPLRESSRTRLSAEIRGIDLDGLRRLIRSLPPLDRETFGRILEPFEEGDLSRVHGSARGRLSTWRDLVEQRRPTLPPGFLIGARIDDAVLRLGNDSDEHLSDLDGLIEWTGDRLETREVKAVWQGRPLPEMALSIEGVSNLLASPDPVRAVRPGAKPIPGLPVLWRWLQAWAEDESDDDAPFPWPRMHLTLHELQHPAVFWPVRDVEAVLQLQDDVIDVSVRSGTWAGAPVRGEAVMRDDPKPSFNASVIALPPPDVTPPAAVDETGGTPPWLRGRLQVESLDRGPLAFESLEGELRATGAELSLQGVRAQLIGGGRLEGVADLELDREDRVPADLSAQLVDGDVERLSGLFGLTEGTVTGTAKLVASLHGPLIPGERRPWVHATGHLALDAQDGEIRRRMPVVVAMAQATEGFNPFAAREAVTYESIRTDLVLEDGRLRSDEFRLEGPMRVFASGSLDLRPEVPSIDAVVGVFLLRQADQLLGKVPIVNWLISDKGMIGAYFALKGDVADPEVDTLQVKTLTEQTPDIIKAPFRVLRFILTGRGLDRGADDGGTR